MSDSIQLPIPSQVQQVASALTSSGFKAFLVGDCVRDLLMGKDVLDYDIITNAHTDDILYVFRNFLLDTSHIRYGEIIVKVTGTAIKVSPYIKDFTPNGTPIYTNDIIDDLYRRIFTVNAICYRIGYGVMDPLGGVKCIQDNKAILVTPEEKEEDSNQRCVFQQYPQGILQALILCATGDFECSAITKIRMLEYKQELLRLPVSLISDLLDHFILGRKFTWVADEFKDILFTLFPDLQRLVGFLTYQQQKTTDLWNTSIRAVGFCPPDLSLRYAALFHGVGIPDCFSLDDQGIGHYHGYTERARILTRQALEIFSFRPSRLHDILFLLRNQNLDIPHDKVRIKYLLGEYGVKSIKNLLVLQAAIENAATDLSQTALLRKKTLELVEEILANKECYRIEDLAINEKELLRRGIVKNEESAKAMTQLLLKIVIEKPFMNTAPKLLLFARDL